MPNNFIAKIFVFWLLTSVLLFLFFFFIVLGGKFGDVGNKYILQSVLIGFLLAVVAAIFQTFYSKRSKNKEVSAKKIWACTFGKHAYNDGEYIKDGSCERKKVCKNCQKEEVNTKHDWTGWKFVNNSSLAGLYKEESNLKTLLSKRVSLQEVKDFCFDVDLDYDNLAGDIEIERIGSLIQVFNKRGSIQEFLTEWKELRPDLSNDINDLWSTFRIHDNSNADQNSSLCLEKKICTRCKKEESREEHQYGNEIQDAQDRCLYVRSCARCEKTKESVKHQWTVPKYRGESDSCEQIKSCMNCQEEEFVGYQHIYVPQTEILEDKSTRSIHVCTRCGDVK
jgi:hypothetical protein